MSFESLSIRLVPPLRAVILAGALLAPLAVTAAHAQDIRDNPFLPNATDDEERKLQERERLKQLVREMMPEFRSMLQPVFDKQKQDVLDDARKAIGDVVKTDAGIQDMVKKMVSETAPRAPDPASAGGASSAPGDPSKPQQSATARLPEGSKFIACINGKALYRDPRNGVNFFFESTKGTPSPCD